VDTQGKGTSTDSKAVPRQSQEPRSLAISERGINTGSDFSSLMSSLMSDIIAGRVTPGVGNAVCNAGGKLLKVVEMQYRYGTQSGNQGERVLMLTPGAKAETHYD
jgi:hypothetical protein